MSPTRVRSSILAASAQQEKAHGKVQYVTRDRRPTFIDLFAGCGGFSLGLSQAGFQGLFAVEKAGHAFQTFRENFIDRGQPAHRFAWPGDSIPVGPHDIEKLLGDAGRVRYLQSLRGKVDLVAGGPPCQGFSFSGRRDASDPRNRLFESYVAFVNHVLPRVIVLENVPGMLVDHQSGHRILRGDYQQSPFFMKLKESLEENYFVHECRLNAADFGVPQRRERLIVLGMRRGDEWGTAQGPTTKPILDLFADIVRIGARQLSDLRDDLASILAQPRRISVREAISDLAAGPWMRGEDPPYRDATRWNHSIDDDSAGPNAPGEYWKPYYLGPDSHFQRTMNAGVPQKDMDSMRLARHGRDVSQRFQEILDDGSITKGVPLGKAAREKFGLLKHRTFPLHANMPAPTLTTLPDDLLHYSEPRILTVREYARLQSFPDSFRFRGKYTTGGHLRKSECPRYTQIGNAVPPLLARAVGSAIASLLQQWPSPPKAKRPTARPVLAVASAA